MTEPADTPVEDLGYFGGFYSYRTFCCDVNDPHYSVILSPTKLPKGCGNSASGYSLLPPPDPITSSDSEVDFTSVRQMRASRGLAVPPNELIVVGGVPKPSFVASAAANSAIQNLCSGCVFTKHVDSGDAVDRFLTSTEGLSFNRFKLASASIFTAKTIEPWAMCFDVFCPNQSPLGEAVEVAVRDVTVAPNGPIAWLTVQSADGAGSWENCIATFCV